MARDSGPSSTPVNLIVVGAGPAGMAAAATVLDGGGTVCLIDSGHGLGGQFWRHPAPSGSADRPAHPDPTYRGLAEHLETHLASGRLRLRLGHHAWTAERTDDAVSVHVLDRSAPPRSGSAPRAGTVTGRRLLIATGAFDRHLPFPGWDLPGVYSAGGLQALLKGNGVCAGSRIIVGGTGPFLLPVASGLAQAGAQVRIVEANDPRRWLRHLPAAARVPGKGLEAARYAAVIARHRVRVGFRTAVVAAHGSDRVEAVTVARLDRLGSPVPGSETRLEVDAVGVGWGFTPQLDLALILGCVLTSGSDGNDVVAVDADQRTSVPGVLVAGEAGGVGGADLAVAEGHLAGATVLADLRADGNEVSLPPFRQVRGWRGQIRRHRVFAAAMWDAHPIPSHWTHWLTDDTIVCRCEEVDVATVGAATASGASGPRQLKQLTRVGMGWCQGRICGTAAACLAPEQATDTDAVATPARVRIPASERLVASPVPLGALGEHRIQRPSAM